MASNTAYNGPNSGLQIGQNHGPITTQFLQSEVSLNQACLRDLRTTSPHDDKDRIERTNGGLLKDSYRWILDNEQFKQWQHSQDNRLLWIRGDPGKGKTMLLCGIIDELTQLHGNAANISFFFCQASDIRINNATSVLRGLIYLLVEKSPSLFSHVLGRYDQAGKALFDDINAWSALSTIFKEILKDPCLSSAYIVIDALDECTNGLRSLLDLIIQESSSHLHIKWIVSSRNWPEIIERLDIATQVAPISLELNDASLSEAVTKFIHHKVNSLAKVKRYKDNTRDTICRYLLSNSQGTFLWVALVCQNLDRTPTRHAIKKLVAFPPGLDQLYSRMIDQVRQSEDAEFCKQILAIMSTVFRPITFSELTSLVEVSEEDYDVHEALSEIIAVCGSFLTLRKDIVTFVHQSAKDFLLREALDEILPTGIKAEHHIIFSRSLGAMFRTLRRDIFDLKLPGLLVKDIRKPSPNPLAAAEYACVYWVDHLQAGEWNKLNGLTLDVRSYVDAFLQQKYLHWLEALSILGSVSDGIQAIQRLEILLQNRGEESLLYRVQDAYMFIRYFKTAVESSPLQVYYSPLVFGPLESETRICYQNETPDWVLNEPAIGKGWSACLYTLEGHSGLVTSIAWSPDGSRLASASDDKTIKIWDPATGQDVSTLQGHSAWVTSISWSPDGSKLASASYDKTVRIWDPATGQGVSTLQGHNGWVISVSWSQDGSRIASASNDKIVKVWDPDTSRNVLTLEGHSGWSHDASRLASVSDDKTVKIWDLTTGHSILTLPRHNDYITLIAWSQDGSRLALVPGDKTVKVWDPVTGQVVSTLHGHKSFVTSITWSNDGGRLASVSRDRIIKIWDPATGQDVSTLQGHSGWVTSISWSPDGSKLASASYDKTVRIWDPATGQGVLTLEGDKGWVTLLAWSPDGSRLTSISWDNTVRIWDPATSQSEATLERHTGEITSIVWSPDGSRLASASNDGTVRIWDPATGQSVLTLQGHNHIIISISWSPDGSRLASASFDETVRIWDLATGRSVSTLQGHGGRVTSISWSPDGTQLALVSLFGTIRIWDPSTGQNALTIKKHRHSITSVAWSQDRSRIASVLEDKAVKIWDSATGQDVSTLRDHSGWISFISWSPDGTLLALASEDKIIKIWDPDTGQNVSLHGHSGWVIAISWSLDGSRLASASWDGTVRIWDLVTGQSVSTIHLNCPSFLRFGGFHFKNLNTLVGVDVSLTDQLTSLSSYSSTSFGRYGYDVNDDYSWITYNRSNILQIPAEYRPASRSQFAVFATTLAIACSSGRVIFLALSEKNPFGF